MPSVERLASNEVRPVYFHGKILVMFKTNWSKRAIIHLTSFLTTRHALFWAVKVYFMYFYANLKRVSHAASLANIALAR